MSTFWSRKRGRKKPRTKYSDSERKAQFRLRLAHAWSTRKQLFGPRGMSPEGIAKLESRGTVGVEESDELMLQFSWKDIS